MRTPIIVIPSYWRKGKILEEDIIYDHPTDLLNPEETLSRTLESLSKIQGNFDVLIIGAPTRVSIGEEMDRKIRSIIMSLEISFSTQYFGYAEYTDLSNQLREKFPLKYAQIISNAGYGNIRNLCTFIPHILGYSIVILLDDDEEVIDKDFIGKATEFIGKRVGDAYLGLVVGSYENEDGSILLNDTDVPWWELIWNKKHMMNEFFQKIEISTQRLIDTPLAFGGNMVIHKKCWKKVPFDPVINRGEDMDYLRNVKLFGFQVKLDTTLRVVHKPPTNQTPYRLKLYQDMARFLYAKEKLNALGLQPDSYDPYPGFFLQHTEGKALLTDLLYHIYHNLEELLQIQSPPDLLKRLAEFDFTHIEHANKKARENAVSYLKFQQLWEELLEKDLTRLNPFHP